MNRGRLRRYAVRVLAAAALGLALIATAGGIAHADTLTGDGSASVGRVIVPADRSAPSEVLWQ